MEAARPPAGVFGWSLRTQFCLRQRLCDCSEVGTQLGPTTLSMMSRALCPWAVSSVHISVHCDLALIFTISSLCGGFLLSSLSVHTHTRQALSIGSACAVSLPQTKIGFPPRTAEIRTRSSYVGVCPGHCWVLSKHHWLPPTQCQENP